MDGPRHLQVSGYLRCLADPRMAPTALRVALFVGTVLFAINHGDALLAGTMTGRRWLAVALTYLVPYLVNIHGQWAAATRRTQGR